MINAANKKKVLIVDDEANVRQLVRRILSKDFEVIEASDGEEAINLTRGNAPEVILMDMMMPKMDGLTACRTIKQDQATNGTTVVMLTAIGYSLNRKLAENAGASAYITKPFDPHQLLGTVKSILGCTVEGLSKENDIDL
jgi:CheY-like chemotaxis protein